MEFSYYGRMAKLSKETIENRGIHCFMIEQFLREEMSKLNKKLLDELRGEVMEKNNELEKKIKELKKKVDSLLEYKKLKETKEKELKNPVIPSDTVISVQERDNLVTKTGNEVKIKNNVSKILRRKWGRRKIE